MCRHPKATGNHLRRVIRTSPILCLGLERCLTPALRTLRRHAAPEPPSGPGFKVAHILTASGLRMELVTLSPSVDLVDVNVLTETGKAVTSNTLLRLQTRLRRDAPLMGLRALMRWGVQLKLISQVINKK